MRPRHMPPGMDQPALVDIPVTFVMSVSQKEVHVFLPTSTGDEALEIIASNFRYLTLASAK